VLKIEGKNPYFRAFTIWGIEAPECCDQQLIDAAGVKRVSLPPRSPNLNAYAERWVHSVKEACLSRLILFGEASLQRALHEYVKHYHHERNHQGKEHVLLFPSSRQKPPRDGVIRKR
jgi:hypothetical protein